jgi:PhnB protein
MLYALLAYHDEGHVQSWSDAEDAELMTELNGVHERLAREARLGPAARLGATGKAVTVRGKTLVTDGPFTETKELIAGFWLWQVRSREEAVEWLKLAPFDGGAEVELRPVHEAEDFGAALTPELREQEERLRAQSAEQRTGKPTNGSAMPVQPYLDFDGRCEEALDYYRKALGAEVKMLLRFADGPQASSQGCTEMVPPGSEKKVMHAEFRVADTTLMASDCFCRGKPSFQGFSIALSPPDDAEAKRLFDALADGGEVRQPLTETFFASSFGVVADRFGLGWMIAVRR